MQIISTHTPVRVWHKPHLYITVFDISTHTPVRVWLGAFDSYLPTFKISTHTPVRVWHWGDKNAKCTNTFQLTHPWGCDHSVTWGSRPGKVFQLTHPWGCDDLLKKQYDLTADFNSHTREGVTIFRFLRRFIKKISTHTPVRVWLKGWQLINKPI